MGREASQRSFSRAPVGLLRGRAAASILLIAALLGAAAGLISAGFWEAIEALSAVCSFYIVRPLDDFWPLPWRWASWAFVLPALGGAVAGALAHWLFKTPRRLGVAAVMLDARKLWGRIPLRYVPATFVKSMLTIATGGSAGREAPVVAMGGGLGAWLARTLGMAPARRRILVAAGGAAAISAAFNAPLAGVFFTLEVILGDWRTSTLAPVMLAAVAGAAVCRATEGSANASHFQVPVYHLAHWWEVVAYAGLGLLAGVVAQAFVRAVTASERRFEVLAVPVWTRPAIGGLAVGLVGLGAPAVLGNGYPAALAACAGDLDWKLLALVGVAKIAATALTLGSGGWGGDFAPTLVVGAMVGGLYGEGVGVVFGAGVASSGAYAMVGMGAVLAAVVRCPVTAVLLLFELTGSYEVILPIMVAVATASFVSTRLSPLGIYHRQLRDLGGPAFETRSANPLEDLVVRDAMRPVGDTLPASATFSVVARVLRQSKQSVVPVLDAADALVGVVRLADLRPFLAEEPSAIPALAAELALEDLPVVTPEMPLAEVASLMFDGEWDELPVVGSQVNRTPVGLLSRDDLLRAELGLERPYSRFIPARRARASAS